MQNDNITPQFIIRAIEAETARIIVEEADAAAVRVKHRVRESAGQIAIAVLKDVRISFSGGGEELIIRVDTRKL